MTRALDIAMTICGQLVDEAIWHEGRCNWLGPRPKPDGARAPRVVVASLTPDLYAGTSGVGLVLAEAATATGDDACRRAALGAIRQSLSAVERMPMSEALGVYAGRPGIALAAVRSGQLLDAPDVIEHALEVAAGVPDRLSAYDLISGAAGAVAGLLAMGSALSDRALIEKASDLGWQLLARWKAQGSWHWRGDPSRGGLLPTGLSHGASGAAWALLELWHLTAEDRFRDGADAAWTSEDAHFDPVAANWPAAPSGGDAPGGWSSQVAWCHGAGGIALARHRAWRLTGDGGRRDEAAVALRTTAQWSGAAVGGGRAGYSLCHGLGGNAEILSDCAAVLQDDAAGAEAVADDIAAFGVEEYGSSSRPWPCGWPGGESPGLMTGLAGIARFYLRRSDPGIPSLLLPTPEEWSPGGLTPDPALEERR